jgi:hypothetical protein
VRRNDLGSEAEEFAPAGGVVFSHTLLLNRGPSQRTRYRLARSRHMLGSVRPAQTSITTV